MFHRRFRRSRLARSMAISCAALMVSPLVTRAAQALTTPGYTAGNSIPGRAAVAIVDAPGGIKVNTYLGSMYLTRNDLRIPGRGLPLQLQMTYNSKDCDFNTAFGYGWRMSYEMFVRRYSANQLIINWGDGRKDAFLLSGGIWTPVNEGVHAGLSQIGPNTLLVTTPQQTRFYFGYPVAVGAVSPLQQMVDPNGNTVSMGYTGSQLTSITDAAGRSISLAYTGTHVTTVTDANSSPPRVIGYQYDASGNMIQATDPVGNVVKYAYDAGHRMTTVTDGLGATKLTYSGTQFLLSSVTRMNSGWVQLSKRSFTYSTSPQPTTTITDWVSGSQNSVTVLRYDASNRLTSVIDPLGHTSNRGYDANGNLTSVTDVFGHSTQMTYDAQANVTSVIDPLGHTSSFAYDAQNRITSATDANGHSTSFAYDGAGNMIQTIDPLGHSTQYAYDATGNMISRTNANGATTSFGYDAFGNQTSSTDPLGHVTHSAYDGAGNMISRTDANGNTVTYAYDGMNRITRKTLPDSSHADYAYDALGNMISAKDSSSDVKYTYDANNRVLRAVDNRMSKLITYQYDGVGNLIKRSGPEPAMGAAMTYDAAGRLQTMVHNGDQFTFAYDAADRRVMTTLPNGTHEDYAYDSANRLTSVINRRSDNAIHSRFDYSLDAVGNRTEMDMLGGEQIQYQYDARDQLIRETRTGGSSNYDHQMQYDAVGNRTQMNADGVITNSFYDGADRLIQDGPSTSYGYDANGNQTQKTVGPDVTTTFYDALDRQTGYQAPGIQATYRYDAQDRRISKTVGGITTNSVYDAQHAVADYTGTALQSESLFGPGTDWNLAKYSGGQGFYYLQDGLNSVRQIVDSSESVRNQYDYDGQGNRVAQTETVANDYTYTGRQLDRESGLYHYRARQYDASTGRFTKADPIDFNAGRSAYNYAGNNPTNRIDPSGKGWFAGLVALVVLAVIVVLLPEATPFIVKAFIVVVGSLAVAGAALAKDPPPPPKPHKPKDDYVPDDYDGKGNPAPQGNKPKLAPSSDDYGNNGSNTSRDDGYDDGYGSGNHRI